VPSQSTHFASISTALPPSVRVVDERCFTIVHASVLEAFGRVATTPTTLRFPSGGLDLGDGHLQGVGLIDARRMVVSASGPRATLLRIDWPTQIGLGPARATWCVVGERPFDHAGGLQICDGIIAVGIEHAQSSEVWFIDAEGMDPLRHLTLRRPSRGRGEGGRWTAGAVGIVRNGPRLLLAVGSYDSDQIDFYRSSVGDLRDPRCRFRRFKSWDKDASNRHAWVDRSWGSYQSLNLLEHQGRMYLAAGCRCGGDGGQLGGADWLDLYAVHLARPSEHCLVKIARRRLRCTDGASLRWGGGVASLGGTLHAVATERSLRPRSTFNVFAGPGGLGR
jgi:hypothetical protein